MRCKELTSVREKKRYEGTVGSRALTGNSGQPRPFVYNFLFKNSLKLSRE
jgi:hypothetical protein